MSLFNITSSDLNEWANRIEARSLLPRLIRKLILETLPNKPSYINFPSDEDIQSRGYDGVIKGVEKGTNYIPSGSSVWELSVEKNVKNKAEDDYKKRTENPGDAVPQNTTYICLTARKWVKKNEWAEEKNKKGVWKEVRVYDETDLSQWLDETCVTKTWFLELLGKTPIGITSGDYFWKEWSTKTSPNINESFLFYERNEVKEGLKEWLDSEPSVLSLQSENSKLSIVFFLAYAKLMNSTEDFFSKIVILNTKSQWNKVIEYQNPLILIPKFDEDFNPKMAVKKGHYILLPKTFGEICGKEKVINIRPLDGIIFEESLKELGLDNAKSRQLAGRCGGSMSTLIRIMTDNTDLPSWMIKDNVPFLIPLSLIGSWDENNEKDINIIEKISGKKYEAFSREMSLISKLPDPPIKKVGNLWKVISKYELWIHLKKYITAQDLALFEDIAIKTLSMTNKKYDKNLKNNIFVADNNFNSEATRYEIANTIALLSSDISEGEDIDFTIPVKRIVQKLMATITNWKFFASLMEELPLLAEAAPDIFMDFMEDFIYKYPEEVSYLLKKDDNNMFSEQLYPSLIWPLEILAWKESYLGRIVKILAMLCPIGFEKDNNRPFELLERIFLSWFPQTSAKFEKRKECLEYLRNIDSELSWKLYLNLLPKRSGDSVIENQKPKWRNWTENYKPGVTCKERYEFTDYLNKSLLDMTLEDCGKWKELIPKLYGFTEENILLAFSKIEIISTKYEKKEMVDIWEELKKLYYDGINFPDAKWTFKGKILKKIKYLIDFFEPEDPTRKYIYLFKERYIRDFERKNIETSDFLKAMEEARVKATKEILNYGGLKLLFNFERKISDSFLLGESSYKAIKNFKDASDGIINFLMMNEDNGKVEFGRGFFNEYFKDVGKDTFYKEEFLEEIKNIPKRNLVDFFLMLPGNKNTWSIIDTLESEIKSMYWKKVSIWNSRGLSSNENEFMLEKFLEYDRPMETIDFICYLLYDDNLISPSPELIVKILQGIIYNKKRIRFNDYGIDDILDYLEKTGKVDEHTIQNLEFSYFYLIENEKRGSKLLYKELSKSPELFAQFIRCVYKSKTSHNIEPVSRERASQIWCVLSSWTLVPGTKSNKEIDFDEMFNWIKKAQEICKSEGRIEACDIHIGGILAHSPQSSKGFWPHESVCKFIEEYSSSEIREGFENGIFNSRGIVTKSTYEGGAQERKLSQKYENMAHKIESLWPTTAAILRNVSEDYRALAKQEDKRK